MNICVIDHNTNNIRFWIPSSQIKLISFDEESATIFTCLTIPGKFGSQQFHIVGNGKKKLTHALQGGSNQIEIADLDFLDIKELEKLQAIRQVQGSVLAGHLPAGRSIAIV